MNEEWREIPGYCNYQVSDYGRVKSRPRSSTAGGILRPGTNTGGYLQAVLYKNGIRHAHRVHSLVLLAFVGPRPEGMEGCHNDGNKRNNCLSNLRWSTKEDNASDREKHGHGHKGDLNGNSKLTPADVDMIRSAYRNGERICRIQNIYGLSWTQTKKIATGEAWKHHV